LDFLFPCHAQFTREINCLPDREFVESYVKAYYMPENIMEEWIQSHSEYSGKQLISLVNCAWQGNKKSKLRLQAIVEELEKARR